MPDESDTLLDADTGRFPAERALGLLLLGMLVATVLLHGGL